MGMIETNVLIETKTVFVTIIETMIETVIETHYVT